MNSILNVLALFAVSGCVSCPSASCRDALPQEDGLFYPTTVGAKLVYQHSTDEVVHVVRKAEKREGTIEVSVDWTSAGQKVGFEKVAVSKQGVLRLEFNGIATVPPYYEFQVLDGLAEGWRVDRDKTMFPFRTTYTVLKQATVEVPAGKYTCYPIRAVNRDRNGVRETITWYAPGVGPVKEIVKTDAGTWATTRILKAFTP